MALLNVKLHSTQELFLWIFGEKCDMPALTYVQGISPMHHLFGILITFLAVLWRPYAMVRSAVCKASSQSVLQSLALIISILKQTLQVDRDVRELGPILCM